MGFKLYDFKGKLTSFDALEDKVFWCQHGERQELAFIKIFKLLQETCLVSSDDVLQIHPFKKNNPFYPDLLVNYQYTGEVKSKNSPLFMARKYNIDPQFALTMDLKDSFNYTRLLKEGIDVFIYIWVKWQAGCMESAQARTHVNPMRGIWKVKFSTLRQFELNNPPPIHWYKEAFRQPSTYSINDHIHQDWIHQLIEFEPRLWNCVDDSVRNITSKGYHSSLQNLYTSGHSSCSYVFDLSDTSLFETLYFSMKLN